MVGLYAQVIRDILDAAGEMHGTTLMNFISELPPDLLPLDAAWDDAELRRLTGLSKSEFQLGVSWLNKNTFFWQRRGGFDDPPDVRHLIQ